MEILSLFGAICGILSLFAVTGVLLASAKQKATAEAHATTAKLTAEAASQTATEARARADAVAATFAATAEACTAKAGQAYAEAVTASASASGIAESLAALNAKISTRWRDEERRAKRETRRARAEPDPDDDDEQQEAHPALLQGNIFGGEDQQPLVTGAKPRLRGKHTQYST